MSPSSALLGDFGEFVLARKSVGSVWLADIAAILTRGERRIDMSTC
jgi:hypothetical protein